MALTQSDAPAPQLHGARPTAVIFRLPSAGAAPVVQQPRRGRLPKAVPSLSTERWARDPHLLAVGLQAQCELLDKQCRSLMRAVGALDNEIESKRRDTDRLLDEHGRLAAQRDELKSKLAAAVAAAAKHEGARHA